MEAAASSRLFSAAAAPTPPQEEGSDGAVLAGAPPAAAADDPAEGPRGGVSLERKLFQAHQQTAGRPRPSEKELNESYAFFTKTEKSLLAATEKDILVDVCGGHGLISMFFLAHRKAKLAIVLDKEERPSLDVMWSAWQDFLPPREALRVDLGDCRATLPAVLREFAPERVGVVACHACSHLTDEVLQMCADAGADFAVMPCCHRDTTRDVDRAQIKHAADESGIELGLAMDLVRMGRMQALGYFVRYRQIDAKISPQNRILVGLAGGRTPGAFGGTEEHRKDSGTSSRDLRKKAALAAAEAEASGELGEAQNKHLENLKQTDSDCTSRGYFKRTDSAVRLSIDMPMM